MNLTRSYLAAFFAASFVAAVAQAADASPAGTWKWTAPGRGGNPGVERTMTLEYKGGALSGVVKGAKMGDFEIPDVTISNASFKDGTVAFSTESEFNGNKYVSKYQGKLAGDTITGEIERPGRDGGPPRKSEWVAKRAK